MQFDIVANDKATPSMGKVEKQMDGFASRMGGKFTMMAAKAALAVAAIQKIGAVLKEGADVADEAARVGLPVEQYQKLKFAADEYGASVEEVVKGFRDMNKLLDTAATKKVGPEMEALQALGFSDQQILDRTIKRTEVFERLAEAIKGASTEEEKYAVASRVLSDKVTMGLIPVLENYKQFETLMADTSALSASAADGMGRLEDAGKRLANTLKVGFLEAVGRVADVVAPAAPPPPASETSAEAERGKQMRAALLASGAPVKKPDVDGMAVTTLQQIGGGIARGPSALESFAERTANATETLANKATEAPAVPPASTDITKPSGVSSSGDMGGAGEQPTPVIRNISNAFFRGRSPF